MPRERSLTSSLSCKCGVCERVRCLSRSHWFSPEIFELRELNDNADLQRTAGRLLAMVTSVTPALDLIEPLMTTLIDVLQNSTVSRCHGSSAM